MAQKTGDRHLNFSARMLPLAAGAASIVVALPYLIGSLGPVDGGACRWATVSVCLGVALLALWMEECRTAPKIVGALAVASLMLVMLMQVVPFALWSEDPSLAEETDSPTIAVTAHSRPALPHAFVAGLALIALGSYTRRRVMPVGGDRKPTR